ncbi:unnamed protein product [Orchesella dallaii]|uniref:28S ribosomal protein S28, mitochondrial n=1 Tax=Orchesella dallaii TaxID=48710 RepID=A0ABP1PRG3_9HEXA
MIPSGVLVMGIPIIRRFAIKAVGLQHPLSSASMFSRCAVVLADTDSGSTIPSSSLPNVAFSKGGFAKAMAKIEGHESFPKTLRYSPLTKMGDPQGKIVEGTIVHVVDNDLYIDFGAKFNCVCPRPTKNGSGYTLGKKVRLMIHDLELSTRFLGAKTDLTILEADCSILGLSRGDLAAS